LNDKNKIFAVSIFIHLYLYMFCVLWDMAVQEWEIGLYSGVDPGGVSGTADAPGDYTNQAEEVVTVPSDEWATRITLKQIAGKRL
jgi:hypothetical protein